MANSPNLDLPYLDAAQAQKHVTHNDALRVLDALVQPAVLSRVVSAPPATPVEGDRYLIPVAATGAWSGHSGKITAYQDGAWAFHAPRTGWLAWVGAENALVVYDGTAWGPALASLQNMALLGVNATADAANKLAVRSAASLFDNVGNGHQLKLNKAAAADTASLLYQDGYSGRAEMGLAGDDDFHLKVSPDGSTWKEALKLDRSSGLGMVFADPTAPLGIATKQYVDAHAGSGGTGPAAWTGVAAWASSTVYVVGPPASVVTYAGGCYVCIVPHTSTGAFDSSKFVQVAAPGAAGATGATGPQGPAGAQGIQGPAGTAGAQGVQGPQGAAGTTGTSGADGKTVLNGPGAPGAGIGANGDYYIDNTAHVIYGPKAAGAWPGSGISLIGPQGPAGSTGAQGTQGLQGLQGIQGPQGPAGATGAQGPQGIQGPQGPGGAAAISEIEIDFGSAAVRSKAFNVTDAGVTASSKIVPLQSGKPATGRTADENEMDLLHLRAVPGSGAFTLYAACLTGRVNGKFKVSYLIG